MVRTSSSNCFGAALCVALVISGCQSTSKWATAWQKPKPNFQGVDSPEEQVTYWPNKPGKTTKKSTTSPGQFKDKFVKKSDTSKRDAQLADLIREGDQLRKSGQLEDARVVYNKAMSLSPDNADVHHRLAIVADKQRAYTEADQHYQAALRLRPRDPKLLNDIGYSYFLRGNLQLAELHLKEALSIDRTHRLAMANLGTIYAQQNRYADALEMCRQGTGSEMEAQQYVAQLFDQNRALVEAGSPQYQGHAGSEPIMTARADGIRDLSKMTQEQIQVEMARLAQESKRLRQLADQKFLDQSRNLIAEDDRYQQQQLNDAMQNSPRGNAGGAMIVGPQNANSSRSFNNGQTNAPQGQPNLSMGNGPASQGNPQYGNSAQSYAINQGYPPGQQSPSMNGMPEDRAMNNAPSDQGYAGGSGPQRMATIYRGPGNQAQQPRSGESQNQPGWDQRPTNAPGGAQPGNPYGNASQLATQLGMNAGPGGMFPVMQGSEMGNAPMGNSNVARDPRFGTEYQRSNDPQGSPNGTGYPIEQTSNTGENPGNEPQGMSIAPMSPANNWSSPNPANYWSSPAMNPLNWQSDSKNLSEWSTETMPQNGQGAPTGNQNPFRRGNGFDMQPGMNSNSSRSDAEMSRPNNRTWPNANAQPQRQNLGVQINGRSPETREILGLDPMGADDGINSPPPANSRSSAGTKDTSSNSLPMYPYGPNR